MGMKYLEEYYSPYKDLVTTGYQDICTKDINKDNIDKNISFTLDCNEVKEQYVSLTTFELILIYFIVILWSNSLVYLEILKMKQIT